MALRSRLVLALAIAALVLAACGSSATVVGDAQDSNTNDSAAAQTTNESTEAPAEQAAPPAANQPTGTLTLSTGQVFELTVSTCETQATDPNSLLNDDFVELSGETSEGYRFIVLNARTAESPPAKAQVGLDGERDENGVNPDVDYVSLGDGADPSLTPLVVNGTQVTGEALLDGKFSRNKPFGDTVNVTYVFNCG